MILNPKKKKRKKKALLCAQRAHDKTSVILMY